MGDFLFFLPPLYLFSVMTNTNPRVFFDLTISDHPTGRFVMKMFADSIPRTAENFHARCTEEKGISKVGKPLHYKRSTFHSVVPGYMVHGGDISNRN
ncbi:hypothetical protein Ddye_015346 [Dipteronia dyeriana]|uniref:Peptidyl-prolyl cis-trans isomerase n=1 Tax=Dipteronia dyeriana TaxID=168575 RepID=A0AAD9U4P7_9ROSI|nr:hypothetical protein Ddye_015346 [Dipteronia dyeriana]